MTLVAIHDDLMGLDGKANCFRFCCPIFITGAFGTGIEKKSGELFSEGGADPEIRSGTLTFVTYNGQIYGLTCRHVVEALEKRNAEVRDQHLAAFGSEAPFITGAQAHFFYPREKEQIHINSNFYMAPGDTFTNSFPDAAVARISPAKLAQIGKEAISLERCAGAVHNRSPTACGIATGYPERNRRRIPTEAPLEKIGISTVIAVAPFEQFSERQITLYYELADEPEADNLSGMSGGPIILSEENRWELVGIVKKGKDMRPNSSSNENSFLSSHVIWIDGEPVTREIFERWIAEIPENDGPISDLSKTLYVPEGYRAR